MVFVTSSSHPTAAPTLPLFLGVLECHLLVGSRGRSGPEKRPGQTPELLMTCSSINRTRDKGTLSRSFCLSIPESATALADPFPLPPTFLAALHPFLNTEQREMNGIHSGEKKNKPQGLLRETLGKRPSGVSSCRGFFPSVSPPPTPIISISNYPRQNLLKHGFLGLTLEFCFSSLEGPRHLH